MTSAQWLGWMSTYHNHSVLYTLSVKVFLFVFVVCAESWVINAKTREGIQHKFGGRIVSSGGWYDIYPTKCQKSSLIEVNSISLRRHEVVTRIKIDVERLVGLHLGICRSRFMQTNWVVGRWIDVLVKLFEVSYGSDLEVEKNLHTMTNMWPVSFRNQVCHG